MHFIHLAVFTVVAAIGSVAKLLLEIETVVE